MARAFTVNKTIGHLRLSKERMRVRKKHGGRLSASVALTRPAKLVVTVGKSSGRRVLFRGDAKPGVRSWRWDGRNKRGGVVSSGRHTVRVEARNELGPVALSKPVRVVRGSKR
jgi:flagellar hook assembly protein FlgD